jgi:hypothetical protein
MPSVRGLRFAARYDPASRSPVICTTS